MSESKMIWPQVQGGERSGLYIRALWLHQPPNGALRCRVWITGYPQQLNQVQIDGELNIFFAENYTLSGKTAEILDFPATATLPRHLLLNLLTPAAQQLQKRQARVWQGSLLTAFQGICGSGDLGSTGSEEELTQLVQFGQTNGALLDWLCNKTGRFAMESPGRANELRIRRIVPMDGEQSRDLTHEPFCEYLWMRGNPRLGAEPPWAYDHTQGQWGATTPSGTAGGAVAEADVNGWAGIAQGFRPALMAGTLIAKSDRDHATPPRYIREALAVWDQCSNGFSTSWTLFSTVRQGLRHTLESPLIHDIPHANKLLAWVEEGASENDSAMLPELRIGHVVSYHRQETSLPFHDAVKVRVADPRFDAIECYARLGHSLLGTGAGAFTRPAPGAEVALLFLGEAPYVPLAIARLGNSGMLPPVLADAEAIVVHAGRSRIALTPDRLQMAASENLGIGSRNLTLQGDDVAINRGQPDVTDHAASHPQGSPSSPNPPSPASRMAAAEAIATAMAVTVMRDGADQLLRGGEEATINITGATAGLSAVKVLRQIDGQSPQVVGRLQAQKIENDGTASVSWLIQDDYGPEAIHLEKTPKKCRVQYVVKTDNDEACSAELPIYTKLRISDDTGLANSQQRMCLVDRNGGKHTAQMQNGSVIFESVPVGPVWFDLGADQANGDTIDVYASPWNRPADVQIKDQNSLMCWLPEATKKTKWPVVFTVPCDRLVDNNGLSWIKIQQGDSLSQLFGDAWPLVYYHPDNQEFRRQRPNPDVIQPGDLLRVPHSFIIPYPLPDQFKQDQVDGEKLMCHALKTLAGEEPCRSEFCLPRYQPNWAKAIDENQFNYSIPYTFSEGECESFDDFYKAKLALSCRELGKQVPIEFVKIQAKLCVAVQVRFGQKESKISIGQDLGEKSKYSVKITTPQGAEYNLKFDPWRGITQLNAGYQIPLSGPSGPVNLALGSNWGFENGSLKITFKLTSIFKLIDLSTTGMSVKLEFKLEFSIDEEILVKAIQDLRCPDPPVFILAEPVEIIFINDAIEFIENQRKYVVNPDWKPLIIVIGVIVVVVALTTLLVPAAVGAAGTAVAVETAKAAGVTLIFLKAVESLESIPSPML